MEQKRCKREAEVSDQVKGLYSERRYLGEIREFRKYNRVSRRI